VEEQMQQVCRLCKTELDNEQRSESFITNGICSPCSRSFAQNTDSLKEFLDAAEAPILVMQSEPRQVLTANQKACGLFKKELSQIEGYRGGQLLDCIHACTEGGCGIDINCKNCKIKNAVVETFTTGKSFEGISTSLQVKKNGEINPYILEISTEKVGELALVRIDQYKKESGAPQ
jgi:hypothetical protein